MGRHRITELSAREQEIMICLCKGMTAKETATDKFISVHTVERTEESIYNKLGAINRANAVALFFTEYICPSCKAKGEKIGKIPS